jgi:bla regulator protein blaR1
MNDLFVFAAHNTAVAVIFALFVYALTRFWRNPAVAHLLWLLVLLKLAAPPVMPVDWSALRWPGSTHAREPTAADELRVEWQKAESHSGFVYEPIPPSTAPASATGIFERDFVGSIRPYWSRGRLGLLWLWVGGAAVCALVAATRIVRFERLLRDTLPASERLQRLVREIAGKLNVRQVPGLRYVECVHVPMLWSLGRRPTIVLPMRLLSQFDDQEAAMILAHELAHLRRRDHWVRAVELIVSIVYWWNPLVWVIRRPLHQAEDLCCDGWVRWAFPDCARRYAEVVLKTAESLSASQVGARLLPASPFLRSLSLKARIEMILQSRFAPRVSLRSKLVIALIAFLVLPSFVETTQTQAWAVSNEEAPATPDRKPTTSTNSEFPYALKFEQGATLFKDGDKVTILEIRGTADTFTPGNIYWIKGTYTLASHDRATLAAYTTAMDAENATGASFKVQTTIVDRGNGRFTLFLPMSCRGWPHVSFYPDDGGEGFGGNYFGTGDSVLKRWWGSKDTDSKATSRPGGAK